MQVNDEIQYFSFEKMSGMSVDVVKKYDTEIDKLCSSIWRISQSRASFFTIVGVSKAVCIN